MFMSDTVSKKHENEKNELLDSDSGTFIHLLASRWHIQTDDDLFWPGEFNKYIIYYYYYLLYHYL